MNYLDQEKRLQIFNRDGMQCRVCGGSILRYGQPQLSHRIPQTKYFIKKYSAEVIHHPLNLVSACCLSHNAAVAIGKSKTALIEKLVSEIRADIEKNR